MADADTLKRLDERGSSSGFGNMFRKEFGDLWCTGRWMLHCTIWTVVINGMFLLVTSMLHGPFTSKEIPEGMSTYFGLLGFAAPMGALILAQGAIVSEKTSGTAAWILSKPVSRSSFFLSKLTALSTHLIIPAILLQGAIFYLHVGFRAEFFPMGSIVLASAIISVQMLFYLIFGLMLGTFFSSRGPVIGAPLAFFFISLMLSGMINQAIPWWKFIDPNILSRIAGRIAAGQVVSNYWLVPVIVTIGYSLIMVAIAIWRFSREEF